MSDKPAGKAWRATPDLELERRSVRRSSDTAQTLSSLSSATEASHPPSGDTASSLTTPVCWSSVGQAEVDARASPVTESKERISKAEEQKKVEE